MLGVNAPGRVFREASIVDNAGQKSKETRASAQTVAQSKLSVNNLLPMFGAFRLLRAYRNLGIFIRLHVHRAASCIARFDSYDFGFGDLQLRRCLLEPFEAPRSDSNHYDGKGR